MNLVEASNMLLTQITAICNMQFDVDNTNDPDNIVYMYNTVHNMLILKSASNQNEVSEEIQVFYKDNKIQILATQPHCSNIVKHLGHKHVTTNEDWFSTANNCDIYEFVM